MRKFEIGQKVKFEESGMVEGIVIDKKYIGIFTQYAIQAKHCSTIFYSDKEEKLHVSWKYASELMRSDLEVNVSQNLRPAP